MHRHDKAVVLGNGKAFKRGSARRIGRYHQRAVLVVAAGGTHCLHEISVQLVDYASAFGVAAVPFKVSVPPARLVHTLENKASAVVLEFVRYLLPEVLELLGRLLVGILVGVVPVFVMYVQNNVHTLVVRIVNNFVNTLKPGVVNV